MHHQKQKVEAMLIKKLFAQNFIAIYMLFTFLYLRIQKIMLSLKGKCVLVSVSSGNIIHMLKF